MRNRNAPGATPMTGKLDWNKMGGLIPVIVQHGQSGEVLMLGYMNREALDATMQSGFVTFFSRSKGRLWQKGESSGNRLKLLSLHADCDQDAVLVLAEPQGPTCHLGNQSCFDPADMPGAVWLGRLADIVHQRAAADPETSYTARLLNEGVHRIAQKIGEEGVEIALAAAVRDTQSCAEETADFIYHLTVLMEARGFGWGDVTAILRARHEG